MRTIRLVSFFIFVSATPAFATFDFQVAAGRRVLDHLKFVEVTGAQEDAKGTGTNEVSISAHLDPLQAIPISFGVFYNSTLGGYNLDQKAQVFEDFRGYEAGPEIMFVVPSPSIIPFAKFGYTMLSRYQATYQVESDELSLDAGEESMTKQTAAFDYEADVGHVAIGLAVCPAPTVGLFIMGDFGMGHLKFKKSKVGDKNTTEDVKAQDKVYDQRPVFNSRAFLAGFEVSI